MRKTKDGKTEFDEKVGLVYTLVRDCYFPCLLNLKATIRGKTFGKKYHQETWDEKFPA